MRSIVTGQHDRQDERLTGHPPISPLTGRPNEITYSCERLFQTLIGSNGSGYPFEKEMLSLGTARATRSKKNVIRCKIRLRNSASSTN